MRLKELARLQSDLERKAGFLLKRKFFAEISDNLPLLIEVEGALADLEGLLREVKKGIREAS